MDNSSRDLTAKRRIDAEESKAHLDTVLSSASEDLPCVELQGSDGELVLEDIRDGSGSKIPDLGWSRKATTRIVTIRD